MFFSIKNRFYLMNFFRVVLFLKSLMVAFYCYLFICLFVFSILVKFNCLIYEKRGFSKMSLGRLHSESLA